MGLPNRKALLSRQTIDGPLGVVDRIDAPHRLRREWGTGQLGQVEQLASPVPLRCHSTCCARGTLGSSAQQPASVTGLGFATGMVELGEPGVGVGLQDPGIGGEVPLRVLAPSIRKRELIPMLDDGLAFRR